VGERLDELPWQAAAVADRLQHLPHGTDRAALLVWGTADSMFPVKWAYHLRDLIPGVREVIEVDGAKLFFPEERPEDLVPHLRRQWGR
jgi:pimeloyl-ACP methyl ester carboxylesterase